MFLFTIVIGQPKDTKIAFQAFFIIKCLKIMCALHPS